MDEGKKLTAAEELLRKSMAAVDQRRNTYGPPTEHFSRTVGMINALFAHKLAQPLTISDWAQIMVLDKLSRHQGRPIEDNPLDVAGYAACWHECCESERRK